MILAHSGLVHLLYGGFFGWWGALGALLPDVLGLIGWWFYLRRQINTGTWYDYMPQWAKDGYWLMHSVPVAGALLITEWLMRVFTGGPIFWTNASTPLFALGYATHVLSDWPTHRQDPGEPLLFATGTLWGVNWWQSRFYWTEWSGLALIVVLVNLGLNNTVLTHVIQAIPC